MADVLIKARRRRRRKIGIRKRVVGSAEQPRMTVFRSSKHIYVQIIDDHSGRTLCAVSTRSKDLQDKVKYGGNVDAAKVVGAALAEQAKERKIERVCFDRNGYKFHGRVRGLADAAREAGLKF